MNQSTHKIKIELKGYEDENLHLELATYESNNTNAVFIMCEETFEGETYPEIFLEITTNIKGIEKHLEKDEILVKTWSENEALIPALLECGYFEDSGKRITVSNFCTASIWKLKLDNQ